MKKIKLITSKKVCYICKKEFSTDKEDKKHHNVRDQ